MFPFSEHLWPIAIISTYLLGWGLALYCIYNTRSAQGAIGWAVSLVTVPYFAIPLYALFGGDRFKGYVRAQRKTKLARERLAPAPRQAILATPLVLEGDSSKVKQVLESLAAAPFTEGNRVELLIDGDQSFESIFRSIDDAREYVLLEFYIVQDDQVGQELKRRLIEKAQAGVKVYFIFDALGSFNLPSRYSEELRQAGVKISTFNSARRYNSRFQLNFRNHRKIVVVDGKEAFVGGHNVGDVYLGKDKVLGYWRDTHLKIVGPAVQVVQLAFLGDLFWADRTIPELHWETKSRSGGDMKVLPIATGPVDEIETCTLFFLKLFNSAQERCWIASPYFVPDESILYALELAALRGVDVRIMIPAKVDHQLLHLASFAYLPELTRAGVKIYRYQSGIMHQKAVLIDDRLSSIGTANLDNRSLRLNFELSVVVWDLDFAKQVAEMLERDFAQCIRVGAEDYEAKSMLFKLGVRFARLCSPLL